MVKPVSCECITILRHMCFILQREKICRYATVKCQPIAVTGNFNHLALGGFMPLSLDIYNGEAITNKQTNTNEVSYMTI